MRDNTRGGTQEYQFRCSTTTGVGDGGRPLAFELSASPNPTRGPSLVRYSLAHAGPMAVGIYDVQGRRLRSLAAGRAEAGAGRLTWDGKDGAGRQLANGIYFVRLTAADGERISRIAILR